MPRASRTPSPERTVAATGPNAGAIETGTPCTGPATCPGGGPPEPMTVTTTRAVSPFPIPAPSSLAPFLPEGYPLRVHLPPCPFARRTVNSREQLRDPVRGLLAEHYAAGVSVAP